MISLKDMFVKKEELRKEQLVIAFDEELVYLTIASLQEEVVDVEKDTDDSFTVTVRSSNPYLGEGMDKLEEIISPEVFPDGIVVNPSNVDTDTYDDPVATLTIDVFCDLDSLDKTYESFVDFLKEKATKYFAVKFMELEKAQAASLS